MSPLNALAFIAYGLITIAVAHYKPYVFWHRADVASLRNAVGNASATWLLYILGGLFCTVGLWAI